jgi:repressor LexA
MMAKKEELSDRQKNILDYMESYMAAHNRPPTIREIGAATGITSTSVVNYNLTKLTEKGFIHREAEVSRGLTLTEKALEYLGKTVGAIRERWDNLLQIPLVGDIVASEPVETGHDSFASYDLEDALQISSTMLPEAVRHDQLFALRVNGDSMIDAMVNDGDYVIMRQQTEAKNGDMVAVWLKNDGTTTLKHFYNEGDRIRLQPANPTMGPIYAEPANVQVQGRVVMVVRQML